MKYIALIACVALLTLGCTNSKKSSELVALGGGPAFSGASDSLPLNTIKLPAGFKISVYAEVEDARSMALSPNGTLFVGNRSGDKVYAVRDEDGDFKADKKWVVASGLNTPNGVALKDGDLYIAEISRISKLAGIEAKLDK
jgi:glucose/arabinose dehydrogenase